MRKLLPHEAIIIAIDDIWNNEPAAAIHEEGVSSEYLKGHKLTRDMTEGQLNAAIAQAKGAGWLLGVGPGMGQNLRGDWSGLGLSAAGLAKVADLTRPWWRTALAALGGDVRTVLVAGIIAVVSAVLTTLVLNLLD